MAASFSKRFFLEAVDSDELLLFRPPSRARCLVEPLIDRSPAFQAMERAVLSATQNVHLAGWVFFANTPLLDADVRKVTGGHVWLDLIEHVLISAPAVSVRILLTDFDPFFETRNHRVCWSALAGLTTLRKRLPGDRRDRLEYMGSLHGFFITPKLVTLGLFSMDDQIKLAVKSYNSLSAPSALKAYSQTPGHWSSISIDPRTGNFSMRATPETRSFIASHHQKFCTVDGRIAFCGGMDLTPLALDTTAHKRRRHPFQRRAFDLSWHDIQCRIEGSIVTDVERNFRDRWNAELPDFLSRVTLYALLAPSGVALPVPPLTSMPEVANRAAKSPGHAEIQLIKTVSVNKSGEFLPEQKRIDILESYLAAVSAATQYVYIENQYFRSTEIVDRIISRHSQMPQLQVILVIPIAPEELTSLKSSDIKTSHPIAVQIEQVDRLQAALGLNFGVFSLVARTRSTKKSFTDAANSPQIYVHSKICIVDDEFASIGSANVNGRSFHMDTELNIAWVQPVEVQKFRLRLWKHLLGAHAADILTWKAVTFTQRWRSAAALNVKQSPTTRGGFAVPHDNENLKMIAKKSPLIHQIFINIDDLRTDPLPPDLDEVSERTVISVS